MPISWIRSIAALVWIAGIAGMIVSSVNGNNNGWVATCGVATALASLCVLAATAAVEGEPIDVFEEARAERLEGDVQRLVADGADEQEVRELIRSAMRLGRRR
jgi:hypothetical protein